MLHRFYKVQRVSGFAPSRSNPKYPIGEAICKDASIRALANKRLTNEEDTIDVPALIRRMKSILFFGAGSLNFELGLINRAFLAP